jgi:hypothetical protein
MKRGWLAQGGKLPVVKWLICELLAGDAETCDNCHRAWIL